MTLMVQDHIDRIRTALEYGGDRLDVGAVEHAEAVLARVDQRFELGPGHTVVALAGATGSGKSSLLNRITGVDVAKVGARRPTTSAPLACQWGATAGPLLDWLEIPRQHRVDGSTPLDAAVGDSFDGLILIDLPDHDSTEDAHRAHVDRMVQLVDMVVWVVDPQKYADDLLHTHYLRPMQGHQAVMVVVLNQVDRLAESDVPLVTQDLRGLLDRQGLTEVPIIPTSATTGQGVDDLCDVIKEAAMQRTMMVQRLSADLVTVQNGLASGVGESEPSLDETGATERYVDALAGAAGVTAVGQVLHNHYRRSAGLYTRWPFVAWMSRVGGDPVQQARLEGQLGVPSEVLVSALPPASTSAQAKVELATRDVVVGASAGLPASWAQAVRAAATPPEGDLTDALDQAIMHTPLRYSQPWWWRVVSVLQWMLALVVIAGLGLTLAQGVVSWFQVTLLGDVSVGSLPLAGAMVLFGAASGLLLSAAAAAWVRMGAGTVQRRAEQRLLEQVREVADAHVLGPVQGVLDDHAVVRSALTEGPQLERTVEPVAA